MTTFTPLNGSEKFAVRSWSRPFKKSVFCVFLLGKTNPCGSHKWNYFGGYCYNVQSQKKLWREARSFCQKEGAALVDIQSAVENQFLMHYVPPSIPSIWIGYNDIDEEGTFVWDRTGMTGVYTNWDAGRLNENSTRHYNLDCVALLTQPTHNFAKGFWTDVSCDNGQSKLAFACKKGKFKVFFSQRN